MPEVSIIIPTFNRSKLLEKTINSILNQTFKDYEIIIVSNGSTDNTEETVNNFQNVKLKYVFQNGSGSPASPRNTGVKHATGKFIAFCDDDDLWMPEKLEKQITFLNNNPEYNMCYTKMKCFDDQSEWVVNQDTTMSTNSKQLLYKNTVPLSSLVIRKNILQTNEWFDEDRKIAGTEDYELLLRLSKKHNIFCIPEYLILYYAGGGRFTNSRSKSVLQTNLKYLTRIYHVYLKVIQKGFFKVYEVICPFFSHTLGVLKVLLYESLQWLRAKLK